MRGVGKRTQRAHELILTQVDYPQLCERREPARQRPREAVVVEDTAGPKAESDSNLTVLQRPPERTAFGTGTGLATATFCSGTGLTPVTSAPGLGTAAGHVAPASSRSHITQGNVGDLRHEEQSEACADTQRKAT